MFDIFSTMHVMETKPVNKMTEFLNVRLESKQDSQRK
jgi:hypothetical protein